MCKVSVVNGRAVIEGLNRASVAVKDGARDGIARATADLALDVVRHTPLKSGKARESVAGRVTPSGNSGKVTYDYKKRGAFYMRFVLLGAKRHTIGLRLKTARGLAAAQRNADRRAAREGRAVAPKVTRKRALAIRIGGRVVFRASVLKHPGLKANPILDERLAANEGSIFSTIAKSVARRLGPFGVQ